MLTFGEELILLVLDDEKGTFTVKSNVVLNDDIPDPHDIVLLALVKSCDLIERIFSQDEREEAERRVYQLSQMDLIGQAVGQTILQEIVSPARMSY